MAPTKSRPLGGWDCGLKQEQHLSWYNDDVQDVYKRQLVALPARERIGRLKYAAEDEAADEFARAMAQLEEEIAGAASEEEPN